MENIFLAVITDDREYGRALSFAMLSVCRSFIIKVFSAEEFFARGCGADLILWDGNEAKSVYGGKVVYLAEKPSDAIKNPAGKKFCIYKYSTAACIVSSVFEIYEALTGRCAVNLKKQAVHLYGFASCAGGSGCTALAISLGQELCRFQGKRVLYLSFEEIESTGSFLKSHMGIKGVGVYLYHLFQDFCPKGAARESNAEGPFLDGYLIRDDFGMESFAPTLGRNPLRELNVDEMYRFLASLIDSGRFDAIIMDLGSWLSKQGLACIEMSEKLCLIENHGRSVRAEQYISHLVCHCGENVLKKMIRVSNMARTGERRWEVKENESFMVENHMDISRCGNVTKDGGIRRLSLEGVFGSEISKLAEKLAEPM